MRGILVLVSVATVLFLGLLLSHTFLWPTVGNPLLKNQNLNSTTVKPTVVTLGEVNNSASVTGPTITYTGIFYYDSFAPPCTTLTPPCKVPITVYYYLAVNETAAYRLIFTDSPNIVNGTLVTATGMLVTPSAISPVQGLPSVAGDIYVKTITFGG